MSGMCYPDSLIGNIPNLYYYAANNPSEVHSLASLQRGGGVEGLRLGGLRRTLWEPVCTWYTPPPWRPQATIAKRRSYANTISYLTPPAENAG